ncbi:MAG: VOC family protein [Chloroflexia bacterium]
MLQGLRTVIYQVSNLEKAKEWYSTVVGMPPYFDEPFYVGYNVGGYELGLDPDMSGASGMSGVGAGGVRAYWGVESAVETYQRLLELGATEHSAVQNVGEGILTGVVLDPFGNLFGIIENPHFSLEQEQ